MSGTTTTPPTTVTTTTDGRTVASKIADYGVIIVSVLVLVVYLIAFGVAYFMKDDKDITLLIGTAIANATTAVGFWLGSSQSSAKKTDLMAANPPPAPVVTTTDPASTVTRTTSTSQTIVPTPTLAPVINAGTVTQ